jgi:hypothetical protein
MTGRKIFHLKTRKYLFLTLFVFFPLILHALETRDTEREKTDPVYVIREIEFDVIGSSRPFALISSGNFKEGEIIRGKDNLDKYLALKKQLLMNQQVLEEVTIEYFTGESESDGAIPVRLLVHVRDTWNLIVLPYPKYDSNDGFSITLKARDYNFLGTMSALRADLGYRNNNGENSVNFLLDSGIPFYAAGLNWILNFDNSFSYTFNEPLYYQNVTGLSLLLPWRATFFTVGFNQYLTVNEENTAQDIDVFDLANRYYGVYASTELFVSWKLPLGIEIGSFGELEYTPGVSGRINYPYNSIDEPRKFLTTFNHSIGFGRIDWTGNYRKGFSASIGNFYSWYFDRSDAPLRIGLNAEAKLYWAFSKYFGVSSKLNYRQWWHWSDKLGDYIPYYSAGDMTRGLINDDIRAYQILTFSLDLPIRILHFWPSEWTGNQKLHIFDFEMHLSPFTDLAIFSGPYSKLNDKNNPYAEKTEFSIDDMINTVGIEILVFPAFFRSLKIRASIGYNLNRIKQEGLSIIGGFFPEWDEIFIGLDHSY